MKAAFLAMLFDYMILSFVFLHGSYPKNVFGEDEAFAAMDKIREINGHHTVRHGVIVEDDILLPSPESVADSGEFSNAIRFRTRLWPGGIVPYVIGSNISSRPNHLRVLLEAMKVWERNTCVRFVKRTNQLRYAKIYYGSDGCHSHIGSRPYSYSRVSLGRSCDLVSVAAHELGHLLGFGHEQNRPDRDEYVNILWENIAAADHRIFTKRSYWYFHSFGVPYDYESLMHYGKFTYSKNGNPTIEARDAKIKWFGGRAPSKLDIKQMNLLYSCPEVPVFPDHFSIATTSRPSENCIAITQPRDNDWRKKFICYKPALRELSITWSQNGPVTGLDCMNTEMPYERAAKLWRNSYLCVPRHSLLKFRWSISGPIRGQDCLEIRKSRRNRRSGYFLCGIPKHKKIDGGWSGWSSWRSCSQQCGGGHRIRTRSCDNPLPQYGGAQCPGRLYETMSCNTQRCPEWPSWPNDFKFLFLSFTPKREDCILIYERIQYEEWLNARMCWPSNKRQITIRWSDKGAIPSMRCIRITQRSGRYQPHGWHDNYLCTDENSPYNFRWSTNGPIKGLACLKWENNRFGRRGKIWQNNYLCAKEFPVPTRAPTTGCFPGWQSFFVNRVPYCYFKMTKKRLSWMEAQEHCMEKKANLVSVVNEAELGFLRKLTGNNIWIGFKNIQGWQWIDRSPVSFSNWSPGEPNNGNGYTPEECALLRGADGKWNDFPCDTKFNYVCKTRGVIKP